jgi:glycine/D-amino acid oxidase-like deaminating enzyme
MNVSPWLAQIKRHRHEFILNEDRETDVVIVGGGIAGLSTAYYLLRDTKRNVLLVEADRIAHGATGHNAGQVVSYFERSFHSIVEEFGLPAAAAGQKAVDGAWDLLEEAIRDEKLTGQLYSVRGHMGICSVETLLQFATDLTLKKQGGIVGEELFVADDELWTRHLPPEVLAHVILVPHEEILQKLETDDAKYFAALADRKGCLNSAMFCEELAGALVEKYADRFQIAEHSPVNVVILREDEIELACAKHSVRAKKVVLCTNGFEHFRIVSEEGADIDPRFHATMNGVIGYMAGYLEPCEEEIASATSYLPQVFGPDADYFYVTKRPYEKAEGKCETLVGLGGPVDPLPESKEYDRHAPIPPEKLDELKTFHQTLISKTSRKKAPAYVWHGLMGYTTNRIRLIGAEPCNPSLLYNLGCNGIGILPSIFGGKRISEILSGKKVEPMIFDPQDQRCVPDLAVSPKSENPFRRTA